MRRRHHSPEALIATADLTRGRPLPTPPRTIIRRNPQGTYRYVSRAAVQRVVHYAASLYDHRGNAAPCGRCRALASKRVSEMGSVEWVTAVYGDTETSSPGLPGDVRSLIENRIATLRREYESGELELQKATKHQLSLQETMLRITGAIQVLEELLMAGGAASGNGNAPET